MPNTPPEPNQYLPLALRALRTARGWSLDKAAAETGVSKAMLGQIERGESSPTIATLWKIASGFNASLSSFLEPLPPVTREGVVFRNANALRHQPGPDGMLVAPLFPYEAGFGFEFFELTLLPAYERYSEAHAAGVTETVIVLSGAMEVMIEGEWKSLVVGDAVRFPADRPHGYRNPGQVPAVFHNLIFYGTANSPAGIPERE